MTHPLARRMAALRRRARLVFAGHAFGWTATVTVAAVVAAALGDYLFRYEETGLRLLSTAAVAAALVWVAYRRVFPACRTPLGDVFLAQQVERTYPDLR